MPLPEPGAGAVEGIVVISSEPMPSTAGRNGSRLRRTGRQAQPQAVPLTAPTMPSVATQNRMLGSRIRPVTGARYARTYSAGWTARIAVVTLRDRPGRLTGWGEALSLGPWRAPSSRASARPGRCPMATTSTSTAVAAVEPVFTESERLALAGFLAGYTGLTREAYALDLRQFASWCQQTSHRPVPGPPRRYRMLRPRPGGPRPRPGYYHPPPVHRRRVLPLRRRGGTPRSLPGRSRPQAPARL